MKAISIPFVARYAKKVSSGMTCFVAGLAMSSIMYFSSYTQNFANFALIYGLGNGIVLGIIYILPIGHCYKFFPKKKNYDKYFHHCCEWFGNSYFCFYWH